MVQLVWFKRDLRTQDHAPLAQAARHGPVLPLYIVEPGYWQLPDTSLRQYRFLQGALADLDGALAALGGGLIIRVGEAVEVLQAINASTPITAIWSHEETGNLWTFGRDRAVRSFCRDHGIGWTEIAQFGVVRGRVNRDRWASHFDRMMRAPVTPEPPIITMAGPVASEPVPEPTALGLADDGLKVLQSPGRRAALALMDSFYAGRGRTYQRAMSSPLTAPDTCSRLSPHLSLGSISMREAVQQAWRERVAADAATFSERAVPLKAIDALIARLHWHCHFIQKLESEPEIERRAVHPAFRAADGARTQDEAVLEAWATGRTGFPFVDACMRSLIATGWINFRMRAMLQAFASYHLALDWPLSGARLARLFTDYEPGIHWPQVQMQSGLTGINTPRIYNPVKQSVDQDPEGVFIRRWLPELAHLPTAALHEPWKSGAAEHLGAGQGEGSYPSRLVDHVIAAREARDRLTQVRSAAGFLNSARKVYERHGSRRRSFTDDNPARTAATKADAARRKAAAANRQLTFDL
jgi:deoxyribodipyrimidine photo-lyase